MAALIATAPKSGAATSANAPLKAPIGVRAMPVITTGSVILNFLSNGNLDAASLVTFRPHGTQQFADFSNYRRGFAKQ
jgi:hypothetical protein